MSNCKLQAIKALSLKFIIMSGGLFESCFFVILEVDSRGHHF